MPGSCPPPPGSGKPMRICTLVREARRAATEGITNAEIRANPAIRCGRIENVIAEGSLLAFDRVTENQHLRCLFNLSPKALKPPAVPAHSKIVASVNDASLTALPAYGALILTMSA